MNGTHGADRVGDLAALRRDLPPGRDLWPAIEAGIRPGSTAPVPAAVGARSKPLSWVAGLAAGFAMLATGVWIGRVLLPGAPATPATVVVPATAGMQWAAFAPGASYEAARAAELARLPARLAALPQPTRDQVRSSLETLQRSIAEIRRALGQEPANALLQSLLIDTYAEEMRVLTTLNATAAAAGEI
jgi:hypothetical protein